MMYLLSWHLARILYLNEAASWPACVMVSGDPSWACAALGQEKNPLGILILNHYLRSIS